MTQQLLEAARSGDMKTVTKVIKRAGSGARAVVNCIDGDGNSPLCLAAQHGHAGIVEMLLSAGAAVGRASNVGDTALVWASYNGHASIVELLLAAGAKINHVTKTRHSALTLASSNGRAEIVELLLAAGSKIDQATNNGDTPLVLAATNGYARVVELLLNAGAEIAHANLNGHTALTSASFHGHAKVVEMLLAAGANINHTTSNGDTALIVAAWKSYVNVVRLLLEGGADVTIKNNGGGTAITCASGDRIAELLRGYDGSATALFAAIARGEMVAFKALVDKHKHARGRLERTPLHAATYRGRLDMVRLLLDCSADVNSRDCDDQAALHHACRAGHVDIVKLLMSRSVLVDVSDADGCTAALVASANGHASVVELLLVGGANIDHTNKVGDTALILAASKSHVNVVRLLLEGGADVTIKNNGGGTAITCASGERITELLQNYDGSATALFAAIARGDLVTFKALVDKHKYARGRLERTPLHVAASRGRLDMVQLLLGSGADINSRDCDDQTPLHLACKAGHGEIVDLLLSRGVLVDASNSDGCTPAIIASANGHASVVELLVAAGANIDHANKVGDTALICSSCNGCAAVVASLLAAGAKIGYVNNNGNNAIIIASDKGHARVVELLLAGGANIDQETNNGDTALVLAASNDHASVVELLLAAGANINHTTNTGDTALIVAAWKSHVNVVRLLLKAGADVTIKNNGGGTAMSCASGARIVELLRDYDGSAAALFAAISRDELVTFKALVDKHKHARGRLERTPLHAATYRGRLDMVQLLLDCGADVNSRDCDDQTALHLACRAGHVAIVKLLLSRGVLVDASDCDGCTPAIIASANGYTSVVEMLLAPGVNIDHANKVGDTALFFAVSKSHVNVVRLLLEGGADVTIKNNGGGTAITCASGERIVELLRDYDGSATALFAAIARGEMVKFKALVDKHKHARGRLERTPLHVAAILGRLDMVRLLLDRGADVNSLDYNDQTPLHLACKAGHIDIVKLLLSRGLRPDAGDFEGRTPAMVAITGGFGEIVCLLLSHGASLAQRDREGRSSFHIVIRCLASAALVEHMLATSKNKDEDVNIRDCNQATPLHYAARAGNADAANVLIGYHADLDAQNQDGETALIIACSRGHTAIVQSLLTNGARTGVVSSTGQTALSAAKSEEIRAAVQLYQNSQRYHERCAELMSSTDAKSTEADLEELVPLITSAYDLRLIVSLISLMFDGESTTKCTARGPLLNAALSHVANSKLVYDDDACVFFKLVLEHCKTNAWLSARELIMLDRQAEKVNNENADWVLELQRKVHDHSWRLDNHEQSLKRVVDGITQVHAMIQENREAIKSVHNRVDNIQCQVDAGKKLLRQVVANGNRLSNHVMHLQKRLEQSEDNVQAVAQGLNDFRNAYVARQEQEERNKRIKMIGGLVASTVGFVFASALKGVFDTVIDLANPLEVVTFLYDGKMTPGEFLADKSGEHVIAPLAQDQFEKFMIPQDVFEELLREQIILQHPEVVEDCVRQGYAIDVEAYTSSGGQAEYAERMQSMLESEASVISGLVGELQVAVNDSVAKPPIVKEPQSSMGTRAVDWSPNKPQPSTDDHATEASREEQAKAEAIPLEKREEKDETSSAATGGRPLERESSGRSEPSSDTDASNANETAVFVGDADAFPFHAAVRESDGDVDEFSELVHVLAGENDDPLAVMEMQLRSVSTTEEAICAAEYAFSLGYGAVGDILVARMEGTDTATLSQIASTMQALSVELLKDDEDFVYVSIVNESEGDARECEDMCEAVERDGHALDARIRAKVVRESSVTVSWMAVEYAAHLGYVDIVKMLLKDWSQGLAGKTKIQLLKHVKRQASASDATASAA